MKNIEIIGTGMAKAKRCITNDDLAKTVDTSDEWITTRTGIKERRFCGEEEDAYTLAFEAAKNALSSANVSANEIDCIVCGTISGEYVTPSMACLVQKELGIKEDIPVLDVNAACSGFIYGLEVARGLLNSTDGRYGLVIGCEHLSKLLDMEDRNTCVLFGDGAGAAVIQTTEEGVYESVLGARGGYEIAVEGPGEVKSTIKMDGKAVFKFAVEAIPKCLNALQEKGNITLDDVDMIVCHQANSRIIDHCVRKLHGDKEKFYKNMDRFGNTSAASVPMALDEIVKTKKVAVGDTLMLVGFGGGLTWAGVLLRIGEKHETIG
ncbi:MAG: ketoacyl-ACP synthase III [Lachnospiraceae bacterium]|nr:ketoacyl-ACP synthase III [Lachnospiraceae bacterium]